MPKVVTKVDEDSVMVYELPFYWMVLGSSIQGNFYPTWQRPTKKGLEYCISKWHMS